MTALELAERYYPRLWDKARMIALVEADKLTAEEYETITGGEYAPVAE